MATKKSFISIIGRILIWIVTIFETGTMAMIGSAKFTQTAMWTEWFNQWGYWDWFVIVIGIGEVVGALLLLAPRIAPYAAVWLAAIMVGALFTVLTNESGNFGPSGPIIHLVFLAFIAWFRRPTPPKTA